VVEATKTGKPIRRRRTGAGGAGHFWDDADRARRYKTLANVDIGAAWQGIRRSGQETLRYRPAVHSFDGKGIKKLSSTFGDTVVASRTS